jgi:hypothetical protein
MRFACLINKATDTHPEYAVLLDFPRKKIVAPTNLGATLPVLGCKSLLIWMNCLPRARKTKHEWL